MIGLAEQTEFVERHLGSLGDWLGLGELASHARDLAAHGDLKASLEAAVADVAFFRAKSWDGVLRLGLYRATQYALVRALDARAAVETGVLHGLSSNFLLQGFADNGAGKLISIDAPSTFDDGPANADGFNDTLPPGLGPGWVVAEPYRRFWDLRVGTSTELLAGVVAELGAIDLFVHDSEHTYETMTFEFEIAWPALRDGGVLVADNIDVNTAFFDFARAVGRMPYVMPVDPDHAAPGASGIRFGLLRK